MGSIKGKRIALIIPSISEGGAERVAQLVGDYYKKRGADVYYFLLNRTKRNEYSVSGEIISLGIELGYDTWDSLLISASKLRRKKREYKIEIAISFMEESNYLNVLSRRREKIILSVHTTLSYRTELKGILYNARIIRLLYNRANIIIAVSEFCKQDLLTNYGLKKNKIKVIPNVALQQDGVELLKTWKYGKKTIVCVGRLDPVKQHDRIIRSFSYVKEKCSEAQLIIAGTGRLKKYLEKICRDYNLEDAVHFVGFVNDVGYYTGNARVFVMASRAEGFPNAMVEAMACGVPVVTTDSPGGCGEIVGKKISSDRNQLCEYGILAPYICGSARRDMPLDRTEEELGNALLRVLNDDQLYMEYSKKSYQRARYYSYERIMDMWASLLY